MQDLPPSVAQDEKKVEPELDAIAKDLNKLENRCRGCEAGRCEDDAAWL
jgi:hypothetical protein